MLEVRGGRRLVGLRRGRRSRGGLRAVLGALERLGRILQAGFFFQIIADTCHRGVSLNRSIPRRMFSNPRAFPGVRNLAASWPTREPDDLSTQNLCKPGRLLPS